MNHTNNKSAFFSIDIASVLVDLKRHWWNILLVLVAGGLLGYAFSTVYIKPVYTSNTVIAVVKNSSSAVANVQSASKLSESITGVLNSSALKYAVSEDLKSTNYTLQVQYITDTNLLSVQASASTPELAFNALCRSIEHYPSLMSNLMADMHVVTVQQPKVATQPAESGKHLQITALGAAFGAVAYCGLIILLSLLRDTVKNSSDMREKVDARLIGKIPYVKEKDALLQLSYGKNFQFEETYQIIASRITAQLEMNKKKILMITSVLPNEGKTHCLLNLAYSIEKSGKKVLVVDGDFRNPSVDNLLNIKQPNRNALRNILQKGKLTSDMLYKVAGHDIYCLTNSSPDPDLSNKVTDERFTELLRLMESQFDYILIDTAPVEVASETAVLAGQCDAVVLLVAQDAAPVGMINDTIDVLEEKENLLGCIYREVRPSISSIGAYGRKTYDYRYRYAVDPGKDGDE